VRLAGGSAGEIRPVRIAARAGDRLIADGAAA
jgi:hypothetical protein